MSTIASPDDKSIDKAGSFSDRLDNVFSLVTTALGEVEASEETVKAIEEEVDPLIDEAEQLEQDSSVDPESLARETQSIRGELDSHDGKLSDHLESIVSLEIEVDEHLSGGKTPTPEGEETTLHRPETPLENICALPEHMVSSELSASQERARFLSRDVRDYGKKAPAGWVIDSGTVKKVLSAKEEGTIYWTQVSRVIEWIDRLGKDGTKIVERHGSRKIVFTTDCVERLERLSANGDVSPNKQEVLG